MIHIVKGADSLNHLLVVKNTLDVCARDLPLLEHVGQCTALVHALRGAVDLPVGLSHAAGPILDAGRFGNWHAALATIRTADGGLMLWQRATRSHHQVLLLCGAVCREDLIRVLRLLLAGCCAGGLVPPGEGSRCRVRRTGLPAGGG